MTYLNQIIKNSRFLNLCSQSKLNKFAKLLTLKEYKNGDIVLSENEKLSNVYYLLNGEFKINQISNTILKRNNTTMHSKSNTENPDLIFKCDSFKNNIFKCKSSFGEENLFSNHSFSYEHKKKNAIINNLERIKSKNTIKSLECKSSNSFSSIIEKSKIQIQCEIDTRYMVHAIGPKDKNITIIEISFYSFFSNLSYLFLDYLKNNLFIEHKLNKSYFFKDIKILGYLGQGSYGKVNLIKIEDKLYALKSISKQMLSKKKYSVDGLYEEKKAMSLVTSPFIVKNHFTLQDDFFCYFVMEYIHGVNLRKLTENNVFQYNKNSCLFYLANIVVILDRLEKVNIIHRDIKTGNIVLMKNGYLKLIDFGLCKIEKDYTNTIIGSPFYMAPEVIKGKGYTNSCDFWSLGIILYEMYFGIFPFGKNCYTTMDVYDQIVNRHIQFPTNCIIDGTIKTIIIELLKKNPKERLIGLKSFRNLLYKFDWDSLIDMALIPPYIPSIKTEFYSTNDSRKRSFLNNNQLLVQDNESNYKLELLNKTGVDFDYFLMIKKNQEEILKSVKKNFDNLFDNF